MFFDLSKFKGVSIQSFDMEEMTGRDSLDAAARAVGPGGGDGARPNAFQLNISHRNQLIAQSIAKVNGDIVTRPCLDWESWSLRTQEFVMAAYMRLNEATKIEIDDFIKAHFDVPGGDSERTSSGSGST